MNNNYFIASDRNLDLITCNGQIENNRFEDSNENIRIQGLSNITIRYNIFNSNKICTYLKRVNFPNFPEELWLNKNNFLNTLNYVIFKTGGNSEDSADVKYNYWDTVIEYEIISKILSKLLRNLSDESTIETQQSLATILGRTVRYEDETVKKRVISLLKIRCEMSQDPIICEVLSRLKEN